MNSVVNVGTNIWIVKSLFSLGAGQTTGLQYEGLKARMLSMLPDGDASPELQMPNESTAAELEEETKQHKALVEGGSPEFVLDSTMTIIRFAEDKLLLHSPVGLSTDLIDQIKKLGEVTAIVAPNLQHWLFVAEAKRAFPDATVYVPAAACDEDVAAKLARTAGIESVIELENGSQIDASIDQRLLEGAPLNMNEMMFYHKPSNTLVLSDGFYAGYDPQDKLTQPGWFPRLWFKLTKKSFRNASLPIYRTSRAASHGDFSALQASVKQAADDWSFEQIICAHGSAPYRKHVKRAFVAAWMVVGDMVDSAA